MTYETLAEANAALAAALLATGKADEAQEIFKGDPQAYELYSAKLRGRTYQQPVEKAVAEEPLSRYHRLADNSDLGELETAEQRDRERRRQGWSYPPLHITGGVPQWRCCPPEDVPELADEAPELPQGPEGEAIAAQLAGLELVGVTESGGGIWQKPRPGEAA